MFSIQCDNSESDNLLTDNKNGKDNKEEIGNLSQTMKVCMYKVNAKYHLINMDLEVLWEVILVEVLNFFDLEGTKLTMQPLLMSGIAYWVSLFSELYRQ